MRVLQVIPYLNPKRGGDVRVCCSISKELSSKGHNVTLVTSDYEFDSELEKELVNSGLDVIRFHCVSSLCLFLFTPSMKSWLRNHLSDFDLVHVHDYRTYQSILVVKEALRTKTPVVLHPHGSMSRAVSKRGAKMLFDILWRRKILRGISYLIAVSEEEASLAVRMGVNEDKLSVIYNGLDVDKFLNLPPKGEFRRRFRVDGRILLYVGRIHKSKGIDFAIRSFAPIARERKETVMIICGSDCRYRRYLQRLSRELGLSDRVLFTDYLDEEDKISALIDCEAFIHTVRYMGGVGLLPLEAVLCRKPVIVTSQCSEVVEKSGGGFVVEFGDQTSLSALLLVLLDGSEEATAMASRGRDFIIANYSWTRVGDRMLDAYTRILRDRL